MPAITSFVVVVAAAKLLPVDQMGLYGVYLSGILIGSFSLGGWLDQTGLREYPFFRLSGGAKEFNRAHGAAVLRVAMLSGGILALFGFSLHLAGRLDAGVVIAGLVLLFTTIFNSLQGVLLARREAFRYSTAEAVRSGATLFASLGLVLGWERSALSLTLAMLLGTAIALPITYSFASIGFPIRMTQPRREYLRRAVKFGFPLTGWFLGTQLLAYADRIMLQAYRSDEEVGIYHANYQLIPGAFVLALAPLLMAAHPLIMRAAERLPPPQIEKVLTEFTRYYLLASVPLAVALAISSPELTSSLLGRAYAGGAEIVPLVLAGSLLWGVSMYGHKRFEIARATPVMLKAVTLSALSNIALNIFLIPPFGALGAAASTLIAYAVYLGLVLLWPSVQPKWRLPWRTLWILSLGIGVSAWASALTDRFIPSSLGWIRVCWTLLIVTATFAALLLLTKELEVDSFRRAMRSLRRGAEEAPRDSEPGARSATEPKVER